MDPANNPTDTGLGPFDPSQPHGILTQPTTSGPASAGTPGGIGQAPTPPGAPKIIDQSAINQAIVDSQQGQPVTINLPWLLSQPDSPSKRGLIAIVAELNKLASGG